MLVNVDLSVFVALACLLLGLFLGRCFGVTHDHRRLQKDILALWKQNASLKNHLHRLEQQLKASAAASAHVG